MRGAYGDVHKQVGVENKGRGSAFWCHTGSGVHRLFVRNGMQAPRMNFGGRMGTALCGPSPRIGGFRKITSSHRRDHTHVIHRAPLQRPSPHQVALELPFSFPSFPVVQRATQVDSICDGTDDVHTRGERCKACHIKSPFPRRLRNGTRNTEDSWSFDRIGTVVRRMQNMVGTVQCDTFLDKRGHKKEDPSSRSNRRWE